MARKDKKHHLKIRFGDSKEPKVNIKEVTDGVKQLIATRIAEKYAEDPAKFARLVEVGLVDEEAIRKLPEDLDFASAVKQFRERLAAMAAEEPSVLGRLDVRPLDVLGDPEQPEPRALPAARLTVVFSDLEGFTSYTSTHGDVEASALLSDHYEAVDAIVRGRGGSVLKTIGDGHMLSFGESRAAVLAGVELGELTAGPLPVRVGGHRGEVLQAQHDLFGHVVNVAARITDIAAGGESLVTTSLRDAAGPVPSIGFDQPRSAQLRGIEDPYDICRVYHL
jgi:adenylate cyclase